MRNESIGMDLQTAYSKQVCWASFVSSQLMLSEFAAERLRLLVGGAGAQQQTRRMTGQTDGHRTVT